MSLISERISVSLFAVNTGNSPVFILWLSQVLIAPTCRVELYPVKLPLLMVLSLAVCPTVHVLGIFVRPVQLFGVHAPAFTSCCVGKQKLLFGFLTPAPSCRSGPSASTGKSYSARSCAHLDTEVIKGRCLDY